MLAQGFCLLGPPAEVECKYGNGKDGAKNR